MFREEAECVGDGISMDTRLARGAAAVRAYSWEELSPSAPALEDMDEDYTPPFLNDHLYSTIEEPSTEHPETEITAEDDPPDIIPTTGSPEYSEPLSDRTQLEVLNITNSPVRCAEVTSVKVITRESSIAGDETSLHIEEIFADIQDSSSLSDAREETIPNGEADTAPVSRCITPEASTSYTNESLAPSAPSLDTIVTLLEESVASSSERVIASSSRGTLREQIEIPSRFKARRPAWVPAVDSIPPPIIQPPRPISPVTITPVEPEINHTQVNEEDDNLNRW